MPYQPQPEAEEEPPRGDTTPRLRTIERWLHHAEDELLYAPDAQGEAAATSLDARYYLRWGGGILGVLAILRFPLDARHPVAQKPYGGERCRPDARLIRGETIQSKNFFANKS